jgi:hypothetical protein
MGEKIYARRQWFSDDAIALLLGFSQTRRRFDPLKKSKLCFGEKLIDVIRAPGICKSSLF